MTSSRATSSRVDKTVADASVDDYDALILPGGVSDPDKLRIEDAVISSSRTFAADKPVDMICHGPWTLVEADLVKGRTLTSYPGIRTDIRNADGDVVDEEVVVDGALVSSRDPDDLPAFCAKIVEVFAAGRLGLAAEQRPVAAQATELLQRQAGEALELAGRRAG